jgi:hypothetical protein
MSTNAEPSTEKGERFRSYSPSRRTALVLTGTGAHGAYHAGVLRALREAGVKIDLLAGHGIGAASAALAAIDGAARLWEPDGVWQSARAASLYRWTPAVRLTLALAAAVAALAAVALALPAIGIPISAAIFRAFLAAVIVLLGGMVWTARGAGPVGRRAEGGWWWRLAGAPLDASAARDLFADVLWQLIRGAAPDVRPSRAALGRRYGEVLRENLGQPGFRELVLVATDLDARRDVVAALLDDRHRADFLAPRTDRDRRSEVLDLAGSGRDHAFDLVAAGLTPPVASDPALVRFAPDSFWRGETHRLCDRPGALHRLLEEVAAAGVEQIIVVSAVAAAERPHQLRVPRLDVRSRLGELQCAAEAAALRDAWELARIRFDAAYLICPEHNPVGPYDVAGAYDQASDRQQGLHELMERAYEDASRLFIEPVVGASGDQLVRAEMAGPAAAHTHVDLSASSLVLEAPAGSVLDNAAHPPAKSVTGANPHKRGPGAIHDVGSARLRDLD